MKYSKNWKKIIEYIINMQILISVDLYQEKTFEENSVHHAKIINEFRRWLQGRVSGFIVWGHVL